MINEIEVALKDLLYEVTWSESIVMRLSERDFLHLTKYLSLYMMLKASQHNNISSQFIPQFMLLTQESESSLQMRFTTSGLHRYEIDDILKAISLESKVHGRRTLKSRGKNKSKSKVLLPVLESPEPWAQLDTQQQSTAAKSKEPMIGKRRRNTSLGSPYKTESSIGLTSSGLGSSRKKFKMEMKTRPSTQSAIPVVKHKSLFCRTRSTMM